jgi:hypothetical protein
VLARLDEYFEFSAIIGQILRVWRDFVHGLWADLLAALRAWIHLDLTANQVDVLSWMVLMLGAAATSAAFGPPKEVLRASYTQAAVFFWLAFVVVAVIFVYPYLPTLVHLFRVAFELDGWPRTVLAAGAVLGIAWLGASHVVSKIVEARAARADATDLTPLWSDIEALLGPFLAGAVIGGVIALPVMESTAAVDRMEAQAAGGALHSFTASGQWLALVLMVLFTFSLLLLRRYNWPTMPRQVAASVGVLIADRLIAWSAPVLEKLPAWFAA